MELLKSRGITPEALKDKLNGDPLGKSPERALAKAIIPQQGAVDPTKASNMADKEESDYQKRLSLLNRIRSRIQEGMTRNLGDFKTYVALDLAWDTPFRQVSPTLTQTFVDTDPNDEQVYKSIQNFGLTSFVSETADPKTGKAVKSLNLPVFFNVFVPLVRSYVTIRWAKIMNDRRLTPFFKYEPVKMTTELGLKCEVLTDRIQVMAQQYGYFETMKKSVFNMLHYSYAIQFVKEHWHFEEQIRLADDQDVANGKKKADGETLVAVGDEIVVTDKEGLRYHIPHPTRTFFDLAYGPNTLNQDTGCEYVGYWRIARYREIQNGDWWNKDKIALGSIDLVSGNRLFFNTAYSACTLTIPTAQQGKVPDGAAGAATFGSGAGSLDREKEIASLYYGTEHGDQGVLVTEYFEKLIPSQNGLGDYDYPVWFRFCVAGDGCTVLYAQPLPFCPAVYYGYDADEARQKNASMTLEILPFQDQFSNILTQVLLTAKQNLANLTMVDMDQIDETTKNKIQGMGESIYRFLNIFGYSGKKAFRGQTRVADVVQSHNFPKGNVTELITVLKTILDVLERVLVMSSQEVAQAASHEQTREEIRNIAQNTSSRQVFTATPVDHARDAWKRQLYLGLMAFGDDDFYAQIPSEIPLSKEVLTKMGFTFQDNDAQSPGYPARRTHYLRAKISKKMSAIPLWEIASSRDNDDRDNREKMAASLAALVNGLLANPITAPAIGAAQAIELANRIAKLMDIPADITLRDMSPQVSPEQQQAEAQAQLKKILDTVMENVHQEVGQAITPLLEATKSNSENVKAIFGILQQMGVNVPQPEGQPTGAPEPPQQMQPMQ